MGDVRNVEWLGYRPDFPDYRDQEFLFRRALIGEMEPEAELPIVARPQRKEVDRHPIFDQGPRGSCVGQGFGLVSAVERNVQARSAMFIYAEARKMIGELHVDGGSYCRDGAKVCATLGAPLMKHWPDTQENLHLDPVEKADKDALKRKLFSYHRLETGHEYRACLASGHLFALGFSVYSNIDDPKCERFGILGMPAGRFEGGHCVAVIGYDMDFRNSEWAAWARKMGFPASEIPEKVYECQNSWGVEWGNGGRFVIPCDYLEHYRLAGDAWTLRGFENPRR